MFKKLITKYVQKRGEGICNSVRGGEGVQEKYVGGEGVGKSMGGGENVWEKYVEGEGVGKSMGGGGEGVAYIYVHTFTLGIEFRNNLTLSVSSLFSSMYLDTRR